VDYAGFCQSPGDRGLAMGDKQHGESSGHLIIMLVIGEPASGKRGYYPLFSFLWLSCEHCGFSWIHMDRNLQHAMCSLLHAACSISLAACPLLLFFLFPFLIVCFVWYNVLNNTSLNGFSISRQRQMISIHSK
jgi:hypothetical protein